MGHEVFHDNYLYHKNNETIDDNKIKNMINLKYLSLLKNKKITDEGIKCLINLEYLNLENDE